MYSLLQYDVDDDDVSDVHDKDDNDDYDFYALLFDSISGLYLVKYAPISPGHRGTAQLAITGFKHLYIYP